ncbi:MAG: [FeFe] hydrogenase H-cluster radical SAM maturase HydE [Lachnospiraceae bacterium]|nr:[FeFe] hydrogenase H-cluster radical SAM maturase HydE [Lachnospiraceae bacterium]
MNIETVDKLSETGDLSDEEFLFLLSDDNPELSEYLAKKAQKVREKHYGKDVYIRGLIEFTNFCKNNCKYCGIRCGNKNADRYRLGPEEIISCGDMGYELGFRTFVLQGGEDPYFTDDKMADIVSALKDRHPDCAVTLSIGERSRESYERLFDAGADRYLLRHETADKAHYESLHPADMSFDNRMRCLNDLRDIGYQVGCGMMIGSPGQRLEHLVRDLRFLREFKPQMVGIGPFVPHHDTEYAHMPAGSVELTLKLLSIIRLILPEVLLPATTALGTLDPLGREKGLAAGANVIMPNLSPTEVRGKYLLYDNKICTGEEAAECIRCLTMRVKNAGYDIVEDRGDHLSFKK